MSSWCMHDSSCMFAETYAYTTLRVIVLWHEFVTLLVDACIHDILSLSPMTHFECVTNLRSCVIQMPHLEFVTNLRLFIIGWRRLIGSPELQIIFHKRATKYRSLLRKMTYTDKGSYESSPPCIKLPHPEFGINLSSRSLWVCHTWLIHDSSMTHLECVIKGGEDP